MTADIGTMASATLKTAALDARRNAFREDIADVRLRGRVDAPRFVEGMRRVVMVPSLPVRRRPDPSLALETEALIGETALVFEEAGGWSWVQLDRDRYVGYVPSSALGEVRHETTHRVLALGTFIYPRADIKTTPLALLSLGSRLSVIATVDRFSELATGGFVITRHLIEFDRFVRDYVTIAERFLGCPYLWGGRTRLGLDCSALVQLALDAAGIAGPRDSDMQQAELGSSVLVPKDLEGLQRGDLVFWPGHVGIMSDGVMMVHSNGHHMAVTTEPLVAAARRIERTGAAVAAVKRLDRLGAGMDRVEAMDE